MQEHGPQLQLSVCVLGRMVTFKNSSMAVFAIDRLAVSQASWDCLSLCVLLLWVTACGFEVEGHVAQ